MATLMRAVLAACVSICTALSGAAHAGSSSSLREAVTRTLVPAVQGLPVEQAYERLHRAGFQVSFMRKLSLPADSGAEVIAQAPRAGTQSRKGDVVKIRLSIPPTGAGSPAVPNELETFTVPDFHQQAAAAAAKWAKSAGLLWVLTIPPLSGGRAPHLLDNYIVVHQEPAAGAPLSLGREEPGGGFKPTPLTLGVSER